MLPLTLGTTEIIADATYNIYLIMLLFYIVIFGVAYFLNNYLFMFITLLFGIMFSVTSFIAFDSDKTFSLFFIGLFIFNLYMFVKLIIK